MTELNRLAVENRRLRARLHDVATTAASLEQRLRRVEDSVIFRFLRWLGGRFAAAGMPIDRRGIPTFGTANGAGPAPDQTYSNWVEEVSLYQRLCDSPPLSPATASRSDHPRVSILLESRNPDRARLERTLSAIDSQQYSGWELLVCTGVEPPEWLDACVAGHRSTHPIEIVRGESERSGLECALGRSRGEFIALVPADVILEPDALEYWLAAAGPETVAAYSDWDHIDSDGRRHTPRFTPGLSPELLSRTLYWGRCYFARTAQVRETNWPGGPPLLPPVEHDLALRLARRSGSISRVARMLWHMQDGGTPVESVPPLSVDASPPARVGDLTSVVICSRNPKQLRKCLAHLMPTLDARHEVIVVAHRLGGQPDLEQAAASYPVRIVPYDGAFHFGIMNGIGVMASKGQVVCLLNDDVYPVAGDWIDLMLAQAARPDVGVVGALLLFPNGTIQHAGVAVGEWHLPAHVGRLQTESPYWPWLRMTREVTAVTGACMVIRRAVWDELGGFDPRFPVNYNDIDLCLRAGERGYRVLMEARAVLTHEESTTRVPNVRPEESELFYDRWGSVMNAPDKFFNPQFGHEPDSIELPSPWTLVR